MPSLEIEATLSFSSVTPNDGDPSLLLGLSFGVRKSPAREGWVVGAGFVSRFPRGVPLWTKTNPGPQPTRKERPIIRPASAMRFSLPLTRESFLGTKPNWFRAPTTLIPMSIAEPMELGSIIGEEGAAGVMSCTRGCRRGYTPAVWNNRNKQSTLQEHNHGV